MKNLHTRVIVLTYFEDEVPLHATGKEQQEWYAVLGRMVAYGLYHDRNKAEDNSTQYVKLGFRKNPIEIDAVYHRPLPQLRHEDGHAEYLGTPEEALTNLQFMLFCNPIVMGAVLHSDGTWGFHS